MKKNKTLLKLSFLLLTSISFLNGYSQAEVLAGGQWIEMNSQTFDSLDDYTENPVNMEFSKYGGWKAHQVEATGYFRVEKIDGRWWAIDPEGYYYIHKALNSVKLDNFTSKQIFDLMLDNGFNGLGNWADEQILNTTLRNETPLAYCPKISFMGEYRAARSPRIENAVFDDNFELFCNYRAQDLSVYANDPHVFGIFSDNELNWFAQGLTAHLAITNTQDQNYIKATEFLASRGKNSSNWTVEDENEYAGLMAERYFSVVSKAIKSVLPNHMYIGSRCNSREKTVEQFMRAAGKYVDVFSNNHYSRWGSRDYEVKNMEKWSGRPLMMTEFYAMDDLTGSATGAGFKVYGQEARGLFYQNYLTTLAETGCVVGWHWFKFQDDQVEVAKGIADINGNIYTELLADMKLTNDRIYDFIDYHDSKRAPVMAILPEADSYFKGFATTNSDILVSKYSSSEASESQTYIRFDLSSITANVTEAKIVLTSLNTGSEVSKYQAELVEDDTWVEDSTIYLNNPEGSTVLQTWSDGGDITIDVTDELLAAMDDNNKLSIRVVSTLSNGKATKFGSSNHSDPNAQPKLLIYSLDDLSVTDTEMNNFKLYPNPVADILNISTSLTGKSNIEIISMLGDIIYSQNMDSKESNLDVSWLNSGVYFVNITNKDRIETYRIMKL